MVLSATLPAGSVAERCKIVKINCAISVHNKNQESLDFNDILDGIRILLKFILSQNLKKHNRNSADLVQKSHESRKRAKKLLEEAKSKVEEMIEKN